MQFPFPVARAAKEDMERAMGFNDLPSTFYIDRSGIVRYQIVGTESHGDSPARVGWFIDQLKQERPSVGAQAELPRLTPIAEHVYFYERSDQARRHGEQPRRGDQ